MARNAKGKRKKPRAKPATTAKTLRGAARGPAVASSSLRYILRQGQPGVWATDHRAESEQFFGPNYIAIHAKAMLVSRAAVQVYQAEDAAPPTVTKTMKREDTGTPVPKDHRFLKLLTRPNPYQSGASFRYEQVVQLSLTGTAISWQVRNAFGLTVERYIVPTCVCTPVNPCPQFPNGGFRIQPWGRFAAKDAQGFVEAVGYRLSVGDVIPVEDCVIVRLPHPIIRGDGFSPTAAVASWIDTIKHLDTSRWAQMQNGPDPSMLVSPPKEAEGWTQAELDAYERRLNDKMGGTQNHGKIFVASSDGAHPLSTNPKDMNYVEGFKQLFDAILAAHGTNKAAVGMIENMTYGSIAAGINTWVDTSVQSVASLLAEEETEQQGPEFGAGLTVEYACPKIDDPDLIEQQIATDLQAGTITKGELRLLRGRPLFGDSRDDEVAGPAATLPAPVPGAVAGSPQASAQSDTALNGAQIDSLLSIVEQVATRVLPAESARAVIGAAFPSVPATTIDAILSPFKGYEAAETAQAGGSGELAGLSRLQLTRNMRAIEDVLASVQAGAYTDQKARTLLSALGLAPQTIDGLLAQPNDQSELEAAAGQVAKTVHSYAVVMALFSPGLSQEIQDLARAVIPKSALAGGDMAQQWANKNADGYEDEPHLTIKWGLLPISPARVARILSPLQPIELTIGNIGVFEADESRDSDVVFLEVKSEDADEAHQLLSENLPHEEAKREYQPHITLAYVAAGQGKKFIGESSLSGQTITVDKLVFSGVNGTRTVIPLAGRFEESPYASILDRMRGTVSGNGNGRA